LLLEQVANDDAACLFVRQWNVEAFPKAATCGFIDALWQVGRTNDEDTFCIVVRATSILLHDPIIKDVQTAPKTPS
jgi:hypothetical protein